MGMMYWLVCVAIIIELDGLGVMSVSNAWVIGILMGIGFEQLKRFLENRVTKEKGNDTDIHR
jgi:hypothetical protein